MKKRQVYTPVFSDVMEDMERFNSGPAYKDRATGITYLPSERDRQSVEARIALEIKRQRRGVIIFCVILSILSFFTALLGYIGWLIYAGIVLILCCIYRFIIRGCPVHKKAFPYILIFLTGYLVYWILTAGAKKYYSIYEEDMYRN